MTIRTEPWPAGTPCWVDLMVPDVAVASRFYEAVLGWSVPEPDEQYGGYVVAERDGGVVAGLGPHLEPHQRVGWTLYFATDDADATAAAVTAAGGEVLRGPAPVGPLGRMVIARDPAGAMFGLWQPGTFLGATLVNAPGGLTWEDLRSTDPDAVRTFFAAVFGFAYDAIPMASADYTTFSPGAGEPPLGGIGGMFGEDGPSRWLVYFGVASASAAADAATAAGGTVVAPPFDTPYGQMAGIADPAGAVFFVVESAAAEHPDR